MEEERKLNMKKVVITIISAIILIAIIAILTKVLTNKKEAVYVANESENINQSQTENISNINENTWKVETKNTEVENSTIADNTNNNNVQNSNTESNSENNIEINQQNNTVAKNITEESNIIPNNTINNTENNATNNTTNNTTNNVAVSTNQNNSTNKKNTTTDNKGVIWLTFDDGPSSNITPKILDILKKENIKATFFVLNYSNSNEALIKREAAEGHTIGIHGYSHEYSKIYKSKEAFLNNVYTLQDKIQKSTGIKTMHIRFPGGSSNTVSRRYSKGIMTKLTKEMLSRGFKYYDWNISSGDAGGAKNAKDVYKNVTKNLSKKRGNMVLMHDFASNKKGLEALPNIIAYAKKNGFTFAPIDNNTPMFGQHINN